MSSAMFRFPRRKHPRVADVCVWIIPDISHPSGPIPDGFAGSATGGVLLFLGGEKLAGASQRRVQPAKPD